MPRGKLRLGLRCNQLSTPPEPRDVCAPTPKPLCGLRYRTADYRSERSRFFSIHRVSSKSPLAIVFGAQNWIKNTLISTKSEGPLLGSPPQCSADPHRCADGRPSRRQALKRPVEAEAKLLTVTVLFLLIKRAIHGLIVTIAVLMSIALAVQLIGVMFVFFW
jgi:hypothetical protein